MQDEVTTLICLAVEGDPQRYIVPGSVEQDCNDCGIKVWVAPSGQKLIRGRATTVVCHNCGLLRVKKEPGPIEITREQIPEIKAWRKRN